MSEILASIEDINAHLPSQEDPAGISSFVIEANEMNSGLIQTSVARWVRGYLSAVIPSATSMAWTEPANTPEIIREIAARFIAAQLYFNSASRTSLTMEETSFAQRKYNEAISLLDKIISGDILLGEEIPIETTTLNLEDFFPVDDTDRAFTLSMEL